MKKKDWNTINKTDFDDLNKYSIFLCLKKKYGFFKSIKYTIKLLIFFYVKEKNINKINTKV